MDFSIALTMKKWCVPSSSFLVFVLAEIHEAFVFITLLGYYRNMKMFECSWKKSENWFHTEISDTRRQSKQITPSRILQMLSNSFFSNIGFELNANVFHSQIAHIKFYESEILSKLFHRWKRPLLSVMSLFSVVSCHTPPSARCSNGYFDLFYSSFIYFVEYNIKLYNRSYLSGKQVAIKSWKVPN